MPMLYIHALCPCCMSFVQILAACLCYMFVLHVHAACPYCMSMLNVHAPCPSCMSVLNVRAAYPCWLFMLHFHAKCLGCMSMLRVHTKWLCCMYLLQIHAVCPWYMPVSMLNILEMETKSSKRNEIKIGSEMNRKESKIFCLFLLGSETKNWKRNEKLEAKWKEKLSETGETEAKGSYFASFRFKAKISLKWIRRSLPTSWTVLKHCHKNLMA